MLKVYCLFDHLGRLFEVIELPELSSCYKFWSRQEIFSEFNNRVGLNKRVTA